MGINSDMGGSIGSPLGGGSATNISASQYAADSGSTDAYAITLVPPITAYTTGLLISFKANTANVGAATLNVNGLGAKAIVKVAGGITTALADNDIRVGQVVVVEYDGTNFQMQSTLGNAPSGGGGANTSTAPLIVATGTVDMNNATAQDLLTVAANRTLIVTRAVFRNSTPNNLADGSTTALQIVDSGTASVIATVSLTGSASTAIAEAAVIGAGRAITAGNKLQAKPNTAYSIANSCVVDVYGYYLDGSNIPVANVNGTGDGAAIAPASVSTSAGIGVGVAAPAAGLATTKTITAAASTGNKTINKTAGTIRIAAAGSSVVLTNSLIDANSIVGCWLSSNDTTAKSVTYVLASGSVTFNLNAAATSEIEIRWFVVN